MPRQQLIEEALTRSIIGGFYEVYNTLGFGFLEHIYVMALERELIARGHRVSRELGVLVTYKGAELGHQRLDMVVDGKVVVETKASLKLHEAAARQVFNYLRATNLEVGLLLHFGPSAHYFRLISSNKKIDQPNQLNQRNLVDSSSEGPLR
jgi:GxxExxY protein